MSEDNKKVESNEAAEAAADAAPVSREQALEAECAKLKDQLQRTMADFQNFRRQSEKRLQELRLFVQKDIFGQVLPVIDNLEAAVEAIKKKPDVDAVIAGVTMVTAMMQKVLVDNRIEAIKAVGELFDPALHEAVSSEPNDSVPSGHVIATLRAGYSYKGKVLRPALVRVAM